MELRGGAPWRARGLCAASLLVSGAVMGGCSHTITSDPVGDGAYSGVAYGLPKGQVLLQASRTQIGPGELAKVQKVLGDAQKAVKKDQDAVTAAGADQTKAAAAQAQLDSDNSALTAAQTSLDQAKQNNGKWIETAALTLLPIVPDPSARYVANLAHNDFRDDSLKLSVVNGLLTTSTAVSIDQTPNIIVTIADTAITFGAMGGGPPPIPEPNQHPAVVASASCFYNIAKVFDPLKDVDAVNSILTSVGAHVQIQADTPDGHMDGQSDSAAAKQATAATPAFTRLLTDQSSRLGLGLYYRIATPVALRVASPGDAMLDSATCPLANQPQAQSLSAIVPDTRSRFLVSSEAGWFTTTSMNYGFSNGMLTDYDVHQPSGFAAAFAIPLKIANDIIQIPTQVVQAKVNYDTQATALVNADANLRAARLQQAATLATAQMAVINAQTALLQAKINQPTAVANAQAALDQAQTALKAAVAANAATSALGP